MKNRPPTGRGLERELGPGPAASARPDAAPSRSRSAVAAALRRQPGPSSLAQLSSITGLHVNTLRDHLQALQDRGEVRRRRAVPDGRGRPAWLYELADPGDQGTNAEDRMPYAALATTLAAAIEQASPDPRGDGVQAGRGWGRKLARGSDAPDRPGPMAARRHLVEIFERLGFAPESDSAVTSVRLTCCPLLGAARQVSTVVCGVHLGIVQGAFAEWGLTAEEVELQPFAEPGACRLLLAAGRRSSTDGL